MAESVPREPIGQRVRHLREQKGWSLTELAERARISRSYLAQIEYGESAPTEDKILRLAEALGARPSELLGENAGPVTIPESLRTFAAQAKLGSAEVQMLAQIEYRGRRPSSPEEWKVLYSIIKAMLEE
jgi:transcriptional regulator with XRE-family HTH domain